MRTLSTDSFITVERRSIDLLRDGHAMALLEGQTVFESLDLKHQAEKAGFATKVAGLKARGAQLLDEHRGLLRVLADRGFDAARHASEIAKGYAEKKWAMALSVLNGVLAMLVFTLTPAPLWMTIVLSMLVLVSSLPVAAFFEAYDRKDVVGEGVFLTLSVLVLGSTFYLGSLRGLFMSALQSATSGPASAALHQIGAVLRPTLGVLTLVSEFLAGYLISSAKHRLCSPIALAVRRRDEIEGELTVLCGAVKSAEAEADIRLRYRTIGARQALAALDKPEPDHAHLRKAAIGAAVALVVFAILLFFALAASAETHKVQVSLVDLSKSQSEETLSAHIETVANLVMNAGNNTRVLALGITDQFGHPRILLDRMIHGDGGMGLYLQASREEARAAWKRVAKDLKPTHKRTSIIGALQLLSFLDLGRNVDIFIFSDGRENEAVNLSHVDVVNVDRAISTVKAKNAIPTLTEAKVYMLGVDVGGKSAAYANSLRSYWARYFEAAGAQLEAFRIDRNLGN
jgi:hypothetical protein